MRSRLCGETFVWIVSRLIVPQDTQIKQLGKPIIECTDVHKWFGTFHNGLQDVVVSDDKATEQPA